MRFNEKPCVLSDVDGVVAYSQIPILETFNARFDTKVNFADWRYYGLLLDEAVRLSGESPAAIAAWLFSEEVLAKSPVIPGAAEAIELLAQQGIIPHFVTSRPPSQAEATKEWFAKELPTVKDVRLRGAEHSAMSGEDFKIDQISQILASIYIDDDKDIIQRVSDSVTEGNLSHLQMIFLVDRPWNDQYVCPPNVTRVGSWRTEDFGWQEIAEIIGKM